VRPQRTCKSVDDTCRKIIEEHHHGSHFIHSTGHGIGLDVHESPNITSKSTIKLKKDMAITVEPGIYIPNKLGVRIEDSVIVRDRPIIMHKFTKDLVVI
jgi:Xaa-Pro aminopeptidase/Xaa-Pro dipeptidase